MKRLMTTALLSAMLAIGGCATAPSTIQTRYELDGTGNLVQRQYVQPASDTNSKVLETALIIGLGIIGFYAVGAAFDVWDSDSPAPAAAPVNNGLVPKSGTTSFSNEFYQPTYVPLQ